MNIAVGDRVELQGLPARTGKVVRIGRTWATLWRQTYFVQPDDTKTGYSVLRARRDNIRWVLPPDSQADSPYTS